MKFPKNILVYVAIFVASISVSCSQSLTENLKRHIQTLASDEFEGRETGTKGEQLAYEYIVEEFKKIGVKPIDKYEGYLQKFQFTTGYEFGEYNRLLINQKYLDIEFDYYPLPHSSNSSASGVLVYVGHGIVVSELGLDDYKDLEKLEGKLFVMELSTPEGLHSHSEFAGYSGIRERIELAIEKGANGVLFINSDDDTEDIELNTNLKITRSEIPVIYIKKEQYELIQNSVDTYSEITVEVNKVRKIGNNLIGYIDNGAVTDVVIGAHYDHLGFGDESSLYRGKVPLIHNGADDNASGTAVVIELARHFYSSDKKNNNYMFIAFSGEEKGLLGSNYYVKNPLRKLSNVNYMINMDMVGRMDSTTNKLIVNGTGTSPMWNSTVERIMELKLVTTESGVGPSDHTSFYLQDIPVLHLFTGVHEDYHKPSDDEDKINYIGLELVYDFIIEIVNDLDDNLKLEFTKTTDSDNENAPRFTVTLGVIPDYAFEGEGMRIDGVSDGKTASKAGIEKGDIVIQMGEIKVYDMMSYMKALSNFKKGDKTKVKVKRNAGVLEFDVVF